MMLPEITEQTAQAAESGKPTKTRSLWKGYPMAFGFVLVALGIGSALEPLLGYRFPMIFFVAASLGAAWYGGFGPGLAALLAGFLVGDFFFVPPLYRLGTYSASDFALLMAYSAVTAIGLAAINALHQTRRRQEQDMELNKKLERLVRERTAELEAFCYSVSHDLRAPLRTISAFSQLVREDYDDKLDDQGRKYLGIIGEAGGQMSSLIDDLLHLSGITRGEMRRQPVDLAASARSIIATLRQLEPQRQVNIVIAPDLRTNGDERLLRIAFENLLNNAWKFTAKQPAPKIEVGSEVKDGQTVFFVRDNGAGFDMAFAERLFGAFQRLHSTAEFPGHGIGLAIVQRIINRHGGRIWSQAAVDQGATFYFTLPSEPGAERGRSSEL